MENAFSNVQKGMQMNGFFLIKSKTPYTGTLSSAWIAYDMMSMYRP
jgi:hypothetical protein